MMALEDLQILQGFFVLFHFRKKRLSYWYMLASGRPALIIPDSGIAC